MQRQGLGQARQLCHPLNGRRLRRDDEREHPAAGLELTAGGHQRGRDGGVDEGALGQVDDDVELGTGSLQRIAKSLLAARVVITSQRHDGDAEAVERKLDGRRRRRREGLEGACCFVSCRVM